MISCQLLSVQTCVFVETGWPKQSALAGVVHQYLERISRVDICISGDQSLLACSNQIERVGWPLLPLLDKHVSSDKGNYTN